MENVKEFELYDEVTGKTLVFKARSLEEAEGISDTIDYDDYEDGDFVDVLDLIDSNGNLLKISLSQLEDCDFESLRKIFESNDAAFINDEEELNVIMDIESVTNDKETALDIIGKYDVEKTA